MPTLYNAKTLRTVPSPERAMYVELADLVEETVRFGSHILQWWDDEDTQIYLEKLVSFGFLRHTIEILDGIPDNLRKEQVSVNKLNLRSLLDTCYNMLYLVQADTSRRARAYLYMDALRKIKLLKRSTPTSPEYKAFEAAYQADRMLNPNGTPLTPSVTDLATHLAKIAEHELNLQDPFYQDVHIEYTRLKALRPKIKSIEWHTFFGGPRSIEDLARNVNLHGMYMLFFRRYSGKIHPSDLINENIAVLASADGFELTPIRRTKRKEEIFEITGVACQLAHEIYQAYVDKFIPLRSQEVRDWYQTEILNRHSQIRANYSGAHPK